MLCTHKVQLGTERVCIAAPLADTTIAPVLKYNSDSWVTITATEACDIEGGSNPCPCLRRSRDLTEARSPSDTTRSADASGRHIAGRPHAGCGTETGRYTSGWRGLSRMGTRTQVQLIPAVRPRLSLGRGRRVGNAGGGGRSSMVTRMGRPDRDGRRAARTQWRPNGCVPFGGRRGHVFSTLTMVCFMSHPIDANGYIQ